MDGHPAGIYCFQHPLSQSAEELCESTNWRPNSAALRVQFVFLIYFKCLLSPFFFCEKLLQFALKQTTHNTGQPRNECNFNSVRITSHFSLLSHRSAAGGGSVKKGLKKCCNVQEVLSLTASRCFQTLILLRCCTFSSTSVCYDICCYAQWCVARCSRSQRSASVR